VHALIEYNDVDQCFVLTDLNSTDGCYVNNRLVKNAKLLNGDLLRFGDSREEYEFTDPDSNDVNINRSGLQYCKYKYIQTSM